MIVDEQRLAIFVDRIKSHSIRSRLELERYWRRRVEEAKPDDKIGFQPARNLETIWY